MSGSFLSDLLLTVSERGRTLLGRPMSGPTNDLDYVLDRCHTLISGQGEATGMAIAYEILDEISAMDDTEELAFFEALSANFGADRERLTIAVAAWQAELARGPESELHFSSEPRRQELFRRLNRAPGGTAALVAIRKSVLRRLRNHNELNVLDRDLHHLLSSWFNRGFLSIRRIDWSTPANILEKIIRYEAVHEIRDWNDLRRRIDAPDRRCYGFFHPALVNEPLIFVEVALTRSIPDAIAPILADDRTPVESVSADTAVFYSISNCQEGLKGVSFGSFLIKQVVEELSRDLSSLKRFVTLSPAPGFRRWVEGALDEPNRRVLDRLTPDGPPADASKLSGPKAAIMPLAAQYFLQAKNKRGEPVDPVARFHLGNGARLERINWLGDISQSGMAGGVGLMVNYLYSMKDVEQNHEAYANHGEVIASSKVTRLLPTAHQVQKGGGS